MAHDIRRTLDEIHMAACYGTEEDPSAAADSLRLIGDLARKALAEIDSAQAEPKSSEPSDAMGMPPCGKPLCSPGNHHPLCDWTPSEPREAMVEAICANYYRRTGRSIDRPSLLAAMAEGAR